MSKLDKDYQDLLQDILENGVEKNTRNGKVLSVFGRSIRYKFKDGKFPLLTTKKMYFKGIVTELLWFLQGDTNIKYLVDNNCHIWDGDCYNFYLKQFEVDPTNFNGEEVAKGHSDQCWGYPILDHVKPTSKEYKRGQINAYLEGKAEKPFFYLTQVEFINKIKTDDDFAKKWGDLGPIYGAQWRSWYTRKLMFRSDVVGEPQSLPEFFEVKVPIDQIQNLINDLKTNPDSRRLMVNAWNVGELDQMVLPPCHYGFQVYTRELSSQERKIIYDKSSYVKDILPTDENGWNSLFNDCNIPTRAISLMWNQRSVDTFLGLPFNIASYGLLLEIIAKSVNMVPDELIGNLGDTHLYLNHIEQAKEQIGRELSLDERIELASSDKNFDPGDFGIGLTMTEEHCHKVCDKYDIPRRTREPLPLPTLNINTEFWPYEGGSCGEGPLDAVKVFEAFKDDNFCKCLLEQDIQLGNYQSHTAIKAPLSN